MPTIKPTDIFQLGDQQVIVNNLPKKLRETIEVYDEWRQRETDARQEFLILQAALRDLGNMIHIAVKEHLDEQANKDKQEDKDD